ncbi:MAG: hypothetical protein ACKVS8_03135 [Phycisphaerales bacterium]
MHIVTKILIVFGAVLSVLLSALTIAYASNADAIAGAFRSEQTARLAAESERASGIALSQAEKASLQQAKETAEAEKAVLVREVSQLQNERSQLITEVQNAKLADQSIKNQIANLTATAEANAAIIGTLNKEVGSLREAQVKGTRRETELVDRLNDLDGQRQVLEQSTRALQEQLAEARTALEQAKSGVSATAGTAQPFVASGPLVQARIRQTFKSPAGDDMAVISEGSNAGLKPNQKLSIVRGGQFVATLVITTTDLTQAVGRIDRLGRTVEIKPEDVVLSRLD